ncbi:hypothetical protein CONLIGDRAFT_420051 [Coniochaeta ligniaria NRRL 30616]|uniref:Uncharacterized protein n=1 Tax=Coniochaeta ligniaria NRRL 30616 TaxID=1408157 RepID=A0A1J7JBX5_9PEZI|nr:hypothetical protein CONLIGDRAFT_420051 [Coniochaeta ligniaria NRRL 30616]
MYGSPYGSYSGMSAPMDITPGHNYSRPQDASCAFPSWPRRSSLSESDSHCERATSYLSDEDLFPSDFEADYNSDARSVSSANSSSSTSSSTTPQHQEHQPYQPEAISEADVLEMQRERAAYQREVMRFLALEKERRRSAARKSKPRSGSSSSKKGSPKSKLAAMTPIAEAE